MSVQNITQPCDSNSQAVDFFEALKGEDGNLITQLRKSDGFVNATKLCRSGGKLWADFYRLKSTNAYIKVLSESMGIPIDSLIREIIDGPNHLRGTWVHPQLAIALAMWVDPLVGVKVTQLVLRYATGQITTEESKAAASIVNNSINPPAYDKVSVKYNNTPKGSVIYLRISLADVVEGYQAPQNTKLIPGCVKFGLNRTNIEQRNQSYGNDGGFFNTIICIENDKEAMRCENAIRAAMKPYTIQHSHEYLNPKSLRDANCDDPDQDPLSFALEYMMGIIEAVIPRSIIGIYRADITAKQTNQPAINEYMDKPPNSLVHQRKRECEVSVSFCETQHVSKRSKLEVELKELDVKMKGMDTELGLAKIKVEGMRIENENYKEEHVTKRLQIQRDADGRFNTVVADRDRLKKLTLKHRGFNEWFNDEVILCEGRVFILTPRELQFKYKIATQKHVNLATINKFLAYFKMCHCDSSHPKTGLRGYIVKD